MWLPVRFDFTFRKVYSQAHNSIRCRETLVHASCDRKQRISSTTRRVYYPTHAARTGDVPYFVSCFEAKNRRTARRQFPRLRSEPRCRAWEARKTPPSPGKPSKRVLEHGKRRWVSMIIFLASFSISLVFSSFFSPPICTVFGFLGGTRCNRFQLQVLKRMY